MTPEIQQAATNAIDFLLSRLVEQASEDSVNLSDAELKQLSFSEGTASPEEIAEVGDFDAANDVAKFEAKVTKLLRRAFKHDVKSGKQSIWQKHLTALRDRDIYVLVMVDAAGIPRPKPAQSSSSFHHRGDCRCYASCYTELWLWRDYSTSSYFP